MHLVVVLHPRGAVLRHLLQGGEHRGVAVVDDVAQSPHALVVWHGKIHARVLRTQWHIDAGRVHERVGQPRAGDLGQDPRLAVVEHVLPGRGPEIVLLAIHHPTLALRDQRAGHRGADLGLTFEQERMNVRVVRIPIGRHEDAGSVRPHLVHVVGHLRLQLAVNIQRQPGLRLGEHEPVTVVIVPRVVVIQVWIRAVEGGVFRVVPVVNHQHLSVRVLGRDDQHHYVVE